MDNITFEMALQIAEERAKAENKQIVKILENDEYWKFVADNEFHPKDDGAGSCYISKKDGSIRNLNLWDIEFTEIFNETAKEMELK